MKKLNVLVACEYSGVVRDAFRKLGHNAWSCDLLPCDGDPLYHVQMDALYLLRSGAVYGAGPRAKWDLMIAHPPCTYLCNSGVRWLFENIDPNNHPILKKVTHRTVGMERGVYRFSNKDRYAQMKLASAFFKNLHAADIPHIAIENPIPHRYGELPKYTQIIQPWQFGHGETKATCLWLKNLPKLVPTNVVDGRAHNIHRMAPGPDRAKRRSRTFEGIAEAMAEQWSKHINEQRTIKTIKTR